MAPSNIVCEEGKTQCYYVYKDAWHVWGRWLLMALLVLMIVFLIIFSGWAMSRRRIQLGLGPIYGFSWMFPNPYKNHKQQRYPEEAYGKTEYGYYPDVPEEEEAAEARKGF